MKYTLVALVFSFSILQINTVFCQQIPGSQEITIDNANDQIYKDSLGNLMITPVSVL